MLSIILLFNWIGAGLADAEFTAAAVFCPKSYLHGASRCP
jgi:hypothetical protein